MILIVTVILVITLCCYYVPDIGTKYFYTLFSVILQHAHDKKYYEPYFTEEK